MRRPPVSVIVSAGGSLTDFRACLDSLQTSAGLRDELVVVLPVSRADLRPVLHGRTGLTVLDDDSGDQAARWAAGCAATSHPVVVLVDGDVIVSPHWLDPVLEALADPEVVATGPRCHAGPGPQQADLAPESVSSVRAFKARARQWGQENAGRSTDVDRLGPVCVAVRRDALQRAGGPGAELDWDRLRAEGRLVVADGALVAHAASGPCSLLTPLPGDAPLLSACLIVKDEEDVLAESLTAARAFADEVVVYDTGSTDRTREIAREHGARVVEGHWNDHFGDARNRALAHCRGRWVLTIDADEVVTGDFAEARRRLSAAPAGVRAFEIGITNLEGHGTNVYGRQASTRLARREHLVFEGRIHEVSVDRITGGPLSGPNLAVLGLVHSGYTIMRFARKEKGERNVRLAQLDVEGGNVSASALFSLARSQLSDGRLDDAIETCQRGLATTPPEQHKRLLRSLVDAYERSDRLAEAYEAVARLRASGSTQATTDELTARLRLREGDHAGALEAIAAIPEGAVDDMFVTVDESRTGGLQVLALAGLGRSREAADRLRRSLRAGQLLLPLGQVATVLSADGSGIGEVVALFPAASVRGLVLAATGVADPLADEVYEALWRRDPAPMVLAGAARLAPRLPVIRAMEWSSRLRQFGLARACPLLALAGDAAREPRDRVLAAAIALELFSDGDALPLLEQALAAVPDSETGRVLAELQELAPGIAQAVEPVGIG